MLPKKEKKKKEIYDMLRETDLALYIYQLFILFIYLLLFWWVKVNNNELFIFC